MTIAIATRVARTLLPWLTLAAGCRTQVSGEGPEEPAPAYSIVQLDEGEFLVSLRGDTLEPDPALLEAYFDNAYVEGDTLRLEGWAADVQAGTPADSVVVFVNGEFLLTGPTGTERPDLVTGFGSPGLRTAGFSFRIPLTSFHGATEPHVRGFAFTLDDRSSPLEYSPAFPWPSP